MGYYWFYDEEFKGGGARFLKGGTMKLKDFNEYVINPQGTKATATFYMYDDDYGYYYDIILKFDDENLSCPFDEDWRSEHYGYTFKMTDDELIERMKSNADELYTGLMKFRTVYEGEDIINYWRNRYNDEHSLRIDAENVVVSLMNDTATEVYGLKHRINQLETDYVLKLESDLKKERELRFDISEQLVEIAKNLHV